jgi:hypothetical protein
MQPELQKIFDLCFLSFMNNNDIIGYYNMYICCLWNIFDHNTNTKKGKKIIDIIDKYTRRKDLYCVIKGM